MSNNHPTVYEPEDRQERQDFFEIWLRQVIIE